MRSRTKAIVAAALAVALSPAAAPTYAPSVADLDAAARAVGNRRDIAHRIGEAVFSTRWSAQVTQISANLVDAHLIVGIRLWGVNFHEPMTRDEFLEEIVALTARTFAAAPATEEIDLWASVPIAVTKGEIVSGDLAKPTSRTVFSITVPRSETAAALRGRAAQTGDGAFWDAQWLRTAFRQPS